MVFVGSTVTVEWACGGANWGLLKCVTPSASTQRAITASAAKELVVVNVAMIAIPNRLIG